MKGQDNHPAKSECGWASVADNGTLSTGTLPPGGSFAHLIWLTWKTSWPPLSLASSASKPKPTSSRSASSPAGSSAPVPARSGSRCSTCMTKQYWSPPAIRAAPQTWWVWGTSSAQL